MVEKNRDLLEIRRDIEEVDKQILTLIKKRADLVKEVKKLKQVSYEITNPITLFIKPQREAEMLRNSIIASLKIDYHPSLYPYITRLLISASNFLEQDINIGFVEQSGELVIREFYSFFANLQNYRSYSKMFEDLYSGTINIAVIPSNHRSINLIKHPYYIFNEISPFKKYNKVKGCNEENFFLIGRIEFDYIEKACFSIVKTDHISNLVGADFLELHKNFYKISKYIPLDKNNNFEVLGYIF